MPSTSRAKGCGPWYIHVYPKGLMRQFKGSTSSFPVGIAHCSPQNDWEGIGVKCLYCTTPVRPVPGCHLQGERVALGGLAHQSLFFTLLELPEILLNQESGIELPNGHLVICKGVLKKINELNKQLILNSVFANVSLAVHSRNTRYCSTTLLFMASGCRAERRDCSIARACYKKSGGEVHMAFG